MEKEKVLEIETQEVFDMVAVRIKYLNDDFFENGFCKEDKEKCYMDADQYNNKRFLIIDEDLSISEEDICCYKQEEISKIKEFVDFVNEKYGIPKRWRAEKNDTYYYICIEGYVRNTEETFGLLDDKNYELGNYFQTEEQAQKVIDSKEWKDFWAKVRAGEIGGDKDVDM